MSNPVRTLAVLLVCCLVTVACLLAVYRRESNAAKLANQELVEVKIRLQGLDGELSAMKERFDQIHDGNPAIQIIPPQTPAADFSEAILWLARLVEQQSNMLAAVQVLAGTPSPSVSPEKALQIRRSEITRLNGYLAVEIEKAATARSRFVELVDQLSIPDEHAAVDISTALATPSLRKYWPYFEAKREYEETQDVVRLVKRKLHIEELELGIQTASQAEEVKQ